MHRSQDLVRQEMQDAVELTAQQLERAIKIAEEQFGHDARSRDPAMLGAILVALGETTGQSASSWPRSA